jgi:chemotaxis protein MotB
MARRKKGSSGETGANWMDTYGDMVTLLLTFFVMLYASSSFDEAKWQYILQAFTSRGDKVNVIVAPEDPSAISDDPFITDELGEGELPETFDQLYQYLLNYIDNNNLSDEVEIEKGAANVYLRFQNQIFFNGDSDILLNTGKIVLDNIGEGIKAVDDKIMVVKICGHTAVSPGSIADDMELSSGRAVSVGKYLRDNKILKPEKIISVGYGSYRPIAPNDNEANRAKNRRVEIIIVRNDADFTDQEVINELLKLDFGTEYVPAEEPPVKDDSSKDDSSQKDSTKKDSSKDKTSKADSSKKDSKK